MFDSVLTLTILALLATAVVGVALSRRRTDPCLKLWRGFPVRLELTEQVVRGGRLRVYGNAFILEPLGGIEQFGYVIHDDEYAGLTAIRRYVDDLTPEELRERQHRMRIVVHPGPWRRSARVIRNWANAIRDALGEAVSTLARGAGGTGTQLTIVRESSVEALTAYYSPVLEANLGQRVVVQVSGAEVECYEAVLHEYSGAFLCLLDATDADGKRVDLILSRSKARVREIRLTTSVSRPGSRWRFPGRQRTRRDQQGSSKGRMTT